MSERQEQLDKLVLPMREILEDVEVVELTPETMDSLLSCLEAWVEALDCLQAVAPEDFRSVKTRLFSDTMLQTLIEGLTQKDMRTRQVKSLVPAVGVGEAGFRGW